MAGTRLKGERFLPIGLCVGEAMRESDKYRRLAQNAVRAAGRAATDAERVSYLNIAAGWEKLADAVEDVAQRTTDLSDDATVVPFATDPPPTT